MATDRTSPLSRRGLLKVMGAAGLGLAASGAGLVGAREASAYSGSPISFGVGPMDRALNSLADNNYNIRAAGLSVTDNGDILVDGTERNRRVLYSYADKVGPYVDQLGDIATARAESRTPSLNGLITARENFNVYNTPIPQSRYHGLPRTWNRGEKFGFSVLPNWDHGPWSYRPWPVIGDFWGLIYVIDPQRVPWVWLVASTAEYRSISPYGVSTAVRTEVIAQRSGPFQTFDYRAEQAVLSVPLLRAQSEYFSYPG